MPSGVYQIKNEITGDLYIGSSKDIDFRCYAHGTYLRRGCHDNTHLQRSWNKYGEVSFSFSTVETCECVKETILAREQYYIEALHPTFNKNKKATSNLGMKFGPLSVAHKAKLSAAGRGKKRPKSTETCARISASLMGKPGPWLGKKRSPETIAKMSAALKARGVQPGQTDAMHKYCKGRPLPAEHREKLRLANTGRGFTPERCANISRALTGRKASEEHRLAQSEGLCDMWARMHMKHVLYYLST